MAKGSPKGSSFEREMCKLLSLWWTNDERDDVFWRTAGSGARAKTRSKTARDTFGQHGDVQATDPIGQPLIDACTIELKRGYNSLSLQDLIDLPNPAKIIKGHSMSGFIRQASGDHCNSGSLFWLLIVKRDRREVLAILPWKLYRQLMTKGLSTLNLAHPTIRAKVEKLGDGVCRRIFATPLAQFLHHVTPEDIRALI